MGRDQGQPIRTCQSPLGRQRAVNPADVLCNPFLFNININACLKLRVWVAETLALTYLWTGNLYNIDKPIERKAADHAID